MTAALGIQKITEESRPMNDSLQYSALTRLLTLNNQVHDLRNQLLGTSVPQDRRGAQPRPGVAIPNSIARMQDEIDQGVRASLATCWLGMTGEPEE